MAGPTEDDLKAIRKTMEWARMLSVAGKRYVIDALRLEIEEAERARETPTGNDA